MASQTGVTGIVLAGTYGSNSAPFDCVPRPLLPVAHRPLISYALESLRAAGIGDVAVCGNRQTRALERAIGRHAPAAMSVTYYADPVPRGTAGSIADAAGQSDADTFVVAEGTAIPDVHWGELLARHRQSGAAATVVVHTDRGTVASGGLTVSTGIYVFSRRALELVPRHGFCDVKETLIPQLHRAGEYVAAYAARNASLRVLDADTYLTVNALMIERAVSGASGRAQYRQSGEALVHEDARIAEGAALVGPVLIEAGAQVGAGAVVVGPCSIGRDATVEPSAMVSRSAIWRRSIVREGAGVDRTIVTDDAIVDAERRHYRTVLLPAKLVAAANQRGRSLRSSTGVGDSWRRFVRALLETGAAGEPAAQ